MRALVTGSAGFVGRHMVAELRTCGYRVDTWDVVEGNDAHRVFADRVDAYRGMRFDLIVHAAASSPHRAAIDREPVHMFRNVALDAAMFEWAHRTGQGRVLYLSSSAVYPVGMQTAAHPTYRLHESDAFIDQDVSRELLAEMGSMAPLHPDAAYGWTKLLGERMAEQARSAGLAVTVVRPFSGYGGDQAPDFPFRALIERARRHEDPFVIWGDGRQVRDWIHIDDVIAGALAVVDSGTTDPVNLCTGSGTSMLDLARMACERVGYQPDIELRADMPTGVACRVGDPSRLRRTYLPTIELAAGIERAIQATSLA